MADDDYVYDGSSTESEPYDDDESDSPASSPPAALASQAPDAAEPSVSDAVLQEMLTAPVSSHNVIDLFAVAAPPPPVYPPPVKDQEEIREQSTPSIQPAVPADGKEVKCGNCAKLTLSEVASLTPLLRETETAFCHCCGLTLPWFCFTEPQRLAKHPECRGCRGVSSVIGFLTARVRKTLGMATDDLHVTGRLPLCSLCSLPLVHETKAQADMPDKRECSCCKRELAPDLFSKKQWKSGSRRRCKGCLGNAGPPRPGTAVAVGMKAWRKANPVDAEAKEAKRLAKEEKKVAKRQRLDTKRQRLEEEKREIFCNKVARHKYAVRALARKRSANDLRGSTRVEYFKQLDKEAAALHEASKRLRSEDAELYGEVMQEKVRHGMDGEEKEKRSKRSRSRSSALWVDRDGELEEDGDDGETFKKPRTSGLVVMTRSQRRLAGM